jgi:S-DNA-T family DNA segregation ATPase FtsK/SpoIIIE
LLAGGALTGGIRAAIAIATGGGMMWCFAIAAGFGWRGNDRDAEDASEDDDAPASISLGWITHGLLSLKARLWRAFARRPPRAPVRAEAPPQGRVEPHFEASGRATAPPLRSAAEEDDEDVDVGAPVGAPAGTQAPRKSKPTQRPPRRSSGGYVLPALELLAAPKAIGRAVLSADALQTNATALEGVLGDFGVRGEIINARPGPVVTLYELEPAPGIKSSRVIGLADDIARSMSALSARVAVVAGRNAIGIELPNPTREKVYLREQLASRDYIDSSAKLPLCLGKTIGGEPVIADLARMPHLLIAGTTGSGKSVAINTMILSLLYRLQPDQCRLIMVDPKMLELSVYDGIPHLLTPVVTDPKKAVVALKWAVREMEERYKKMSKLGVRNIDGYNARVSEAKSKGEKLTRTVHTGYDKESGEAIYETEDLELEPLPFVVVIVDEMADLMMVAGKDIEGAVQRLAQMARAAGLHVILATQRPSVDVITGTIKANFPTRISFQVTSKIDSRTILGEQGAEQLLGQGDMLYMAGGGRISRVHGPFCSDEEVEKVVRHLKSQGTPQYLDAVTAADEEDEDGNPVFDATGMGEADGGDLYQQAVQVVLRDRKASTSYIQRRLQIGYNRAASLMERMEKEGVVGQANHAGKREILVGEEETARY